MNKYSCKECSFQTDRQVVLASHVRKNHRPIQIFKKVNFEDFKGINTMNIESVISSINNNIIINGRISPSIHNMDIIIKRGLIELLENIKWYTIFLKSDSSIKLRIYCILNNIKKYPKCTCGRDIIHNNKNTNIFNIYCSQNCANRESNYNRTEIFYQKVSEKIVKTRKANGSYIPSDSFKNYLKDPDNMKSFRKKCKDKYGVENPGVLGAYSSKSAELYIREYITIQGINESLCYFKGGGINKKEYFIMEYDEKLNKNKYMSYDLVVLDDNNNIKLVLEYNGPWHYKYEEMIKSPNESSTPYPKSKSKLETYNFDIDKLNLIRKKCNNIFIFWEKEKSLVAYNGANI